MAIGVSSHLLVVKTISTVIVFGRKKKNRITHKKSLSAKAKATYKSIKNKDSN